MDKEKFWLVWCETKRPPTFKHDDFEKAQREAERLARANPGHEFHVLEWQGACVMPPYDVNWRGCDAPLPF